MQDSIHRMQIRQKLNWPVGPRYRGLGATDGTSNSIVINLIGGHTCLNFSMPTRSATPLRAGAGPAWLADASSLTQVVGFTHFHATGLHGADRLNY
jgi:hypothetical protein